MTSKVKEGDRAPDFTLATQGGGTFSMHDSLGKKNVVLYFYPKDFTAGCTAETRAFSTQYKDLMSLDAEVVGISSDSVESHEGFAQQCSVSFPLASDTGGHVRDLYGVKSSLGVIPGRVTFVVDKQGVVRRVYSSQLNPKKHVEEALEALKQLE